jgi:hypothetical protein
MKYLVNVSERTSYNLEVEANSEKEARRIVRNINKGSSCITDFKGGDAPTGSPITIHSAEEIK